MLTSLFEAVDRFGRANSAGYGRKSYWSYLSQRNGFHRMFVLAFLLLDCIWDELGASYMVCEYVTLVNHILFIQY
jgi:hypothetical protein